MKKIAIVANTAWNIYNFRLKLAKAFIDDGYKILLIAPEDTYVTHFQDPSIKFIPLKQLNQSGKSIWQDSRFLWELYQIYKKERPDTVLHFTIKPNIYGSLAARLAGIPNIATITGLGYVFMQKNFLQNISKMLYKQAFQFATHVVFENQDDRQLFLQNKIVKSSKTSRVNGAGVDASYFSPLPKNKIHPYPVFLFVGRLLRDKGIMEFLDACILLQERGVKAHYWVLGGLAGNDNPAVISTDIWEKKLSESPVKYLGTTTTIRSTLRNIDCLVLPSYREGLPLSILEAMSMAKPIITTDTAGCRDTVAPNENGFLVPIKSVTPLADAMEKMAALPNSRREDMGRISRKMVLDSFEHKIIIKRYKKLVSDLIGVNKVVENVE